MFDNNIKAQSENFDNDINKSNVSKKSKLNILNSPYLFLITFSTSIALILNMPELTKKYKIDNKYNENNKMILITNNYILSGIINAYADKILNNTNIIMNSKKNKEEIKKEIINHLIDYIHSKIALNLPSEKERRLFYIMIKENINEEHINEFLKKYINNLDEVIVDAILEFESNFSQDIKSKNNLIYNKKIIRNI